MSLSVKQLAQLEARLLRKSIKTEDGCWLWLGTVNNCGYGKLNYRHKGHKSILAHRLAYILFKGEIPDAHDLDHRKGCPRNCINPEHLTPRPYREHRAETYYKANPPQKPL